MGTVVHEFDRLLTAGSQEEEEGAARERLAGALTALRSGRTLVQDLLISDPRSRSGLWELNSTLLATADRMLDELDAVGRAPTAQSTSSPTRRATLTGAQRVGLPRRSPTRQGSSTPAAPPAREQERG